MICLMIFTIGTRFSPGSRIGRSSRSWAETFTVGRPLGLLRTHHGQERNQDGAYTFSSAGFLPEIELEASALFDRKESRKILLRTPRLGLKHRLKEDVNPRKLASTREVIPSLVAGRVCHLASGARLN